MKLENLDMQSLIVIIPIGIAVVKGITNKFNITDSLNKELVTLLVALSTVAYLAFKETTYMQVLAFFITAYFGMSGIYSFLPQSIKNQDKVANEDAYLSLIATETYPDYPVDVVGKEIDEPINVVDVSEE